jgi:hypothetical protein
LEDDVGVATNLGERLLASRAHVIPVADVRRQNLRPSGLLPWRPG